MTVCPVDKRSSPATRAKSAALTTERYQAFIMTGVTTHPQKAVLQPAALEVVFKFLLDIAGQRRTLRFQVGFERRIVFLDKLVKESAFRAVAFVVYRRFSRC